MIQDNIKVTILLATYNCEKFLRTQLDSIIYQTHTNWELIVSDDSSSDKTSDILDEYKLKYPEKIYILNNEKRFGNARDNFFHLLENCIGSYIMFCDHDDKWLPKKIELTLAKMLEIEKKQPPHTPVMVHTDLNVVDGELNMIASSLMKFQDISPERIKLNNLLVQNVITGCTVMINKELKEIGMQVKSYKDVLMHDWWLALAAAAFGAIGFVNEPTIMYRQHGNNSVGAKNTKSIGYILNKMIKNDEIKASLYKTTLQAGEFYSTYSNQLSCYDSETAYEYSKLYEKGKMKRIASVFKYNFFKYGFARKAAQIIWG